MSILVALAISLITGVAAGVASGYAVGRYFEFHAILLRAVFSMRLFARDEEIARQTLDDLQMVRDQLISRDFGSAEAPLNRLIDWARQHMHDRTIEVEGKRDDMMPFIESLRPSISELFHIS